MKTNNEEKHIRQLTGEETEDALVELMKVFVERKIREVFSDLKNPILPPKLPDELS